MSGDMDNRTVREVGEFGLIAALHGALPSETTTGPALALGIGDDAAIWRPTPGEALVLTADGLVEGVHFRLDPGWTDWASLGHKALVVNLSDLAAMGAAGRLATLTLGLRGTERVVDLTTLYTGIGALAARAGLLIVGGDIVASHTAVNIHVTAIGETRGGRALTRAGARPGDVIAVSGTLGASAAGLRVLGESEGSPLRRAATASTLIEAHLRPEPRLALGEVLLAHGATAAMDVSDGLLGDLPKLLTASGVGGRLDAAAIPVAAAVQALFPDDWLDLATRGGEDYELLFTVPSDALATIQREGGEIGATVTAIGEITRRRVEEPLLVMRGLDGVEAPVQAGAFDHFR